MNFEGNVTSTTNDIECSKHSSDSDDVVVVAVESVPHVSGYANPADNEMKYQPTVEHSAEPMEVGHGIGPGVNHGDHLETSSAMSVDNDRSNSGSDSIHLPMIAESGQSNSPLSLDELQPSTSKFCFVTNKYFSFNINFQLVAKLKCPTGFILSRKMKLFHLLQM